MEYIVVDADSLEVLTRLVNEKVAYGWKCQGGISVYAYRVTQNYSESKMFYQAMIKN